MSAADGDTIDHGDTVVAQGWHILHHMDAASARLARHRHIGALVTSQGVEAVRGNHSQGPVVMVVMNTVAGSDNLLAHDHSPGSVVAIAMIIIGDSVLPTDTMSVLLMILVTQHNTDDNDDDGDEAMVPAAARH